VTAGSYAKSYEKKKLALPLPPGKKKEKCRRYIRKKKEEKVVVSALNRAGKKGDARKVVGGDSLPTIGKESPIASFPSSRHRREGEKGEE